jgi:flagellar protein FlaG
MNSEITSVLKLVPVTVVKTDKQENGKASPVNAKAVVDLEGTKTASAVQDNQPVSSSLLVSDENKQVGLKPSLDVVKKAAEQGNSILQATQRNLQIKVDDATKETVVKIVDSESGELVRQIPSEDMLAFIRRMQELQGEQGSVIQDRA